MAEPANDDLVGLAQHGDLDALTALYDQHYNMIFRYLRARLGDGQAVEDLTGEVFKRMLAVPAHLAHGDTLGACGD